MDNEIWVGIASFAIGATITGCIAHEYIKGKIIEAENRFREIYRGGGNEIIDLDFDIEEINSQIKEKNKFYRRTVYLGNIPTTVDVTIFPSAKHGEKQEKPDGNRAEESHENNNTKKDKST